MSKTITTGAEFREFAEKELGAPSWAQAEGLDVRFLDAAGDNVDGFGDHPGDVTVQFGRITNDRGTTITTLATMSLSLLLDAAQSGPAVTG